MLKRVSGLRDTSRQNHLVPGHLVPIDFFFPGHFVRDASSIFKKYRIRVKIFLFIIFISQCLMT